MVSYRSSKVQYGYDSILRWARLDFFVLGFAPITGPPLGVSLFRLYRACSIVTPFHGFGIAVMAAVAAQVLAQAARLVRIELQRDPSTLFLVGTYSIGKERVLAAVAKAAKSRCVHQPSIVPS